jgi:hypothetical protein
MHEAGRICTHMQVISRSCEMMQIASRRERLEMYLADVQELS